jgi:hypothetical protein
VVVKWHAVKSNKRAGRGGSALKMWQNMAVMTAAAGNKTK